MDAHLFGAGMAAEAYRVAFRIPNLLRDLLGEGVLASAVVPVLSRQFASQGEERAWRFARALVTRLSVVLLVVVAVGVAAAPFLVTLLAPGWQAQAEKFALTVRLTRIVFPFIALASLSAIFMAILNCRGIFGPPALTTVFFNLVMIGTGFLVCPRLSIPIYGWAAATVLGQLVGLLWMLPWSRFSGMVLTPAWRSEGEGIRQVMALMLPSLVAQSVTQVNLVVNTMMASTLPEGSMNWLYYSNRLMQLPLGLVGASLGTAVLPVVAAALARGEPARAQEAVGAGLSQTIALTIPAAAGLAVLSFPILRLLFEHGRFTTADCQQATPALLAYAAGIPAAAVLKVVVPCCYAVRRPTWPVATGIACVAVNIAVGYSLLGTWRHAGLAFGTTVAAWINVGVLLALLRRTEARFDARAVLGATARAVASTAFMALALFLYDRTAHPLLDAGRTGVGLYVAGGTGVGLAFYFLMSRVFRARIA